MAAGNLAGPSLALSIYCTSKHTTDYLYEKRIKASKLKKNRVTRNRYLEHERQRYMMNIIVVKL